MLPAVALKLTAPLVVMGALEKMERPALRLMAPAKLSFPRATAWIRSELVPRAARLMEPLRPASLALEARVRLPEVAVMVVLEKFLQ